MYTPTVERLLVNFKTLEEFKNFKRYGEQELSMLEDLQANIIEDNSESPFYGIYFGDSLVGRMSLYMDEEPFVELFKLEILPALRSKGFGTALVNYAKSLQKPIKTIARIQSEGFWLKQGFSKQTEDAKEFYIWDPHIDKI